MDRNELFESISAYIDGEIGDHEAAEVRRALDSDAEARQVYESLKDNAAQVAALPRHASPDSILDGIRHQLEREALLDGKTGTSRPPRRRRLTPRGLSLAASLLIVLAAGVWAGIYLSDRNTERPLAARSGPKDDALASGSKTEAELDRRSFREQLSDSTDAAATDPDSLGSGFNAAMVPAGDGMDAARLLNVEQKLKFGTETALLQQHRFENEPMRLQVAVADEDARRRMESRVESLLRTRRIADLSQRRETQPPRAFYQSGRIGVNYDDTRTEQILVRLPQSQLEELIADVGSDQAAQSVDLRLNELRVEGAAQVQSVVAQLGKPLPPSPEPPAAVAVEPETADAGNTNNSLIGGFLSVFRLNSQMLKSNNGPDQDAVANAGRTVTTPTDLEDDAAAEADATLERSRTARRRQSMADAGKEEKADTSPQSPAEQTADGQVTAEREEPSLVKRRLEAAEARQRAGGADEKRSASAPESIRPAPSEDGTSPVAGGPSEPMVTLVLELVVADPAPGRPPAADAREESPRPPSSPDAQNNNGGSMR